MDTTRRNILLLSCLAPLVGLAPRAARSEPITASLLLTSFAKAAAAYAGQRLAASLFNGSEGPSNADVIAAIEKSTSEIKAFVSRDIRDALTEAQVRELKASAQTAFDELLSYSSARPDNRGSYAFRLENADRAARGGANLANDIGDPGIAVYAIFISLRIVSESEIFQLRGDEGVYKQFGRSLLTESDNLSSKVDSFLGKRSIAARLGTMSCSGMSNGAGQGGLDAPSVTCEMALDGVKVVASSGFTAGSPEAERRIVQLATDKYRQTEQMIMSEYSELVQGIGNPLLEISGIWRGVSSEITGESVPVFRNDSTVEFKPIPAPPF